MEILQNHTCPLCGQPNACAVAKHRRHDVDCWCAHAKIDPAALALVPEAQRRQACICAQCAQTPPQP
ncbi:MAG TPA: cysteine-rich CWC family protein [Rhodocyclaceae bacterium]|nr:cysteine-rich CWC family protein [Rhodocyclaceae bacterium]